MTEEIHKRACMLKNDIEYVEWLIKNTKNQVYYDQETLIPLLEDYRQQLEEKFKKL